MDFVGMFFPFVQKNDKKEKRNVIKYTLQREYTQREEKYTMGACERKRGNIA